ncbi:MAG: hypothetical protein H6601_04760 [Flavobacteriales bacterium]|nr:hypothetical protein [Flavobacteriales bacterium]
MELLIAFLIAFGVITTGDAAKIKGENQAQELIKKSGLEKDYIIWEAEADDF